MSPLLPTPASVQAAQAVVGIEMLLSGLRSAKVGDRWVDTVKSDTAMAEGSSKGSRIANWTVKAGEGGQLEFDATWSGTTTNNVGGMQMEMMMTGSNWSPRGRDTWRSRARFHRDGKRDDEHGRRQHSDEKHDRGHGHAYSLTTPVGRLKSAWRRLPGALSCGAAAGRGLPVNPLQDMEFGWPYRSSS